VTPASVRSALTQLVKPDRALIVVVGACTVFLLRQMYLNELDREEFGADDPPAREGGDE